MARIVLHSTVQYHSNIPDCFIYVYSFALYPEDPTPSGSCNVSRIDHVDLALQLQDHLGKEQVTIIVFARNWNVLRFREGLAGLRMQTSHFEGLRYIGPK